MLTEEEATTKWCPWARDMIHEQGKVGPVQAMAAVNRKGSDFAKCIASECMAWRFNSAVLAADNIDRRGYCGLAGVPG